MQSGVGLLSRMSKVDTDQGLGPGSEDRRREVRKAQDDLDSRSKLKAAETEPGIGKVERRSDTVDELLDGFGTSRPDLPHRILPKEDTTPPPEPVRRELTPTEPGKRQRLRNMILASVVSFGVIVGVGVVAVRMSGHGAGSTAAPPTATATATETAVATATATETVPPITTMSVEALPTVATGTATTSAPATHPHHSGSAHPTSTTPPQTTATATTTAAPHPTGSAPPGLNLLPDDPHR